MLQWLRRRAETTLKAEELYGNVVTAARQPVFYDAMGVPDTPEGRFELVALHLFLAIEASNRAEEAAKKLTQRMIEVFVNDMDDCMREMGVGDLTVPKKVKTAAAAFYERAATYRRDLLESEAPDLARSLQGYIFAHSEDRHDGAEALARYMRTASSALTEQPFDVFVESGIAGRLLASGTAKTRIVAT
jgi:cytochrome b pre-mRNA-processing protein 3